MTNTQGNFNEHCTSVIQIPLQAVFPLPLELSRGCISSVCACVTFVSAICSHAATHDHKGMRGGVPFIQRKKDFNRKADVLCVIAVQ